MALNDFLFTSESVSEGHPDKLADQVSDAVLDALLAQDPHSRVACETLTTTGLVMLELNTQPGMTPLSLAPEQVKWAGISWSRLMAWMVDHARQPA